MKQELEKIYVQPLKSISQYIQITKIIDFSEGSLSISILDIFTMNVYIFIYIMYIYIYIGGEIHSDWMLSQGKE